MSDFNRAYIKLLRKQVEVEIKYLKSEGHNQDKIIKPCIFCRDTYKKYYKCDRLSSLNQFLSELVVRLKGLDDIEKFNFETENLPELFTSIEI